MLPMSVPAFHNLAAAFCAAAHVTLPPLIPNGEGITAFTAQLDEVEVSISHDMVNHADHAFVLVMFGEVPEHQQARAWQELLHANLLMLGEGAPAFSLNPLDGQVILQYVYPLAQATGEGLLGGLKTAVATALQWRQTFSLT